MYYFANGYLVAAALHDFLVTSLTNHHKLDDLRAGDVAQGIECLVSKQLQRLEFKPQKDRSNSAVFNNLSPSHAKRSN